MGSSAGAEVGAAEGRICFRVSASGGLLWWELQRRKRDGQRVGDVLGAGVVGGEFEAGRVFFSRVWLGMDVLVGTAAPESGWAADREWAWCWQAQMASREWGRCGGARFFSRVGGLVGTAGGGFGGNVVTAALESGWAADRHEQIGDVLAWCAGWLGAGVGGE